MSDRDPVRRFGLPVLVLMIAALFWWLDQRQDANKVDRDAAAVSESKSSSTQSAEEFVREPSVARWEPVEDFEKEIALFESVFWEPADTTSLRKLIRETDLVRGRDVLEIGTGSGLVSLVCLKAGAQRVVATDINESAVRNAVYNAQQLELLDRFEVRLVPRGDPSAWAVVREGEKFDLIISNPPWEDATPETVAEFALYDPGFALLKSILSGAQERLKPGGRLLLAYGCVTAIRRIEELAPDYRLSVRRLDERSLEQLPEVFLPGMLLELRPSADK